MRYIDALAGLGVWESRLALLFAVVIAAAPCWVIITTPVGLGWQALFALGSFALCSWMRRYEGHLISIALMTISFLTSFLSLLHLSAPPRPLITSSYVLC